MSIVVVTVANKSLKLVAELSHKILARCEYDENFDDIFHKKFSLSLSFCHFVINSFIAQQ